MKQFTVDTQTETIELGNDSLKFDELAKIVNGKLMSVSGEVTLIDSAIMDRLSVSADGSQLLWDGIPLKGEVTAADILADLPTV